MEKYFSESSNILVNKIHFIQIQSCSMATSVDGKFENVNNLWHNSDGNEKSNHTMVYHFNVDLSPL